MDTVRIDKFLWSVRLFKTRNLAVEACEKHRVSINGVEVKPSRNVKTGDKMAVKKPPVVYTYDVVMPTDKRQPAALVKNYIMDVTPREELDKANMVQVAFVRRDRGMGRPTKRERRMMEKLTLED
ncbi:MAG: RNA-binding S4 domain-containing protein [Bacteroidales bacterium]|nr:RNA-binding S4 domain-containing protein [Bacteroidales bacterium]